MKGNTLQLCFVIIQGTDALTLSTSHMMCAKYDAEARRAMKGEDVPFLTSISNVFDTKSVSHIPSSRCTKVGIPFEKDFILDYFAWVLRSMTDDPIRLFSYLYSELVLRGCNVSRYHSLLFSNSEFLVLPNDHQETDVDIPITEELKEKIKDINREMACVIQMYLKLEASMI